MHVVLHEFIILIYYIYYFDTEFYTVGPNGHSPCVAVRLCYFLFLCFLYHTLAR